MADNYTGPAWVGPLFKWTAAAAVLYYVIALTCDTEKVWACNE